MIPAYHSGYVLDASVAAKWFVRHREQDVERAILLRDAHRAGRLELVIPEFGLLEILNAVRYAPRAAEPDGARAVDLLEALNVRTERLAGRMLRKANGIAWAYGIAVYDAAYVALAEDLGLPLITADEVLLKKMQGHSIVLRLSDMQFPEA
jgi:predicted nucleic acid-binding protein